MANRYEQDPAPDAPERPREPAPQPAWDGGRPDASVAAAPAADFATLLRPPARIGRGGGAARDAALLHMQRLYGNAAVQRVLQRSTSAVAPPTVMIARQEASAGATSTTITPTTTSTTATATTSTTAAPGASGAAPSAAGLKADAQTKHEAQQRRVATLVDAGIKSVVTTADPADSALLFRNSCQWIAAGKSALVVLTPTHDAATRQPNKGSAYFDKQVKYPDVGGDYSEQPSADDADHIDFAPPKFGGMTVQSEHRLYDPAAFGDDQLKATITHEVQHAADLSNYGQPGRVPGSPGITDKGDALRSAGHYNEYQTEFRAYWIENPEGSPRNKFGSAKNPATNATPVTWSGPLSTQVLSVPTHFANERQEKIFWHLAKHELNELAQVYVQDAAFRGMVDALEQPAGMNLVNSVRIQAVTEALAKCAPGMDAAAPAVQAALRAAAALDDADRAFLGDPAGSAPFWQHAAHALSPPMLAQFRLKVLPPPVGDFPPNPSWLPPGTALA